MCCRRPIDADQNPSSTIASKRCVLSLSKITLAAAVNPATERSVQFGPRRREHRSGDAGPVKRVEDSCLESLPPYALALTCGVDVQEESLEIVMTELVPWRDGMAEINASSGPRSTTI